MYEKLRMVCESNEIEYKILTGKRSYYSKNTSNRACVSIRYGK